MQGLTFCCLTVARSGPLVGGSTQAWHDRNLVERVAVALVVGVMLDAVRCGTEDVGATPRRDLLAVLLAAADVLRGGHIDRFDTCCDRRTPNLVVDTGARPRWAGRTALRR